VRSTCAAHDDGEDVNYGAMPLLTYGIGEGSVFGTTQMGCVGGLVVRAVFPFPYLNLFNREVPVATVRVAYESRFG
jgi:hypothetical protein